MLRAKPCRPQHVPQDFPVARRWARHPDRLAAQPLVYLPPRRGHAHGPFEDPLIAGKPYESEQTRPWQTERNRLAQPLVQPGPRPLVLRERCRECLDEDTRVHAPHRNASPSAAASAEATSSTFGRRHRPRSTGWVRYGAGGRGSCMPASPRRNASFTTSLSGLSSARRNCSIRAATSSSRDKVVLMHQSILQFDASMSIWLVCLHVMGSQPQAATSQWHGGPPPTPRSCHRRASRPRFLACDSHR